MTQSEPITIDIRYARVPQLDIDLLDRCAQAVIAAAKESEFDENDLHRECYQLAYTEMVIRAVYVEIALSGGAVPVCRS